MSFLATSLGTRRDPKGEAGAPGSWRPPGEDGNSLSGGFQPRPHSPCPTPFSGLTVSVLQRTLKMGQAPCGPRCGLWFRGRSTYNNLVF